MLKNGQKQHLNTENLVLKLTDILVNKFLFIIMFIAYQATDLDVLSRSTEKINFQNMGPDMMHLPYSCLCFCGSFNWFRSKNEQVYSKNCFLSC